LRLWVGVLPGDANGDFADPFEELNAQLRAITANEESTAAMPL
jgi:hypothetical protein